MRDPKKETIDGDHGFIGADLRTDPSALPPGMLADGENLRMRNGVAATRKGVTKPAWANITEATLPNKVQPYPGTIYGVGTFKDPASVEWHIVAAAGNVYKVRPSNAAFSMPLPTGVKILTRCKVVQAFDKIYLFRGRNLQPLRCTDLSVGFVDLLARWDAAATYAPNAEVAFGPQLPAALTSASNTVTATATAHGYVTSADVVVTGATQPEYNGRFNVTVVDSGTFTYTFAGSATSPATGTPLVSNMARYWKALGSNPTLTSLLRKVQTGVTITRVGTTATATLAAHGFANGDTITVAGAVQPEYDGPFVIGNVTANTWDYTIAGAPATPATGTITARTWKRAVATTATAHGFSNGDSVTIAGATPASWNATYTVSNTAALTFEIVPVVDPGADATGTITARNNTKVVVGQSPDSNPEAWARTYIILPNADDAIYVNNRLLVPTAYAPGGSAYGATSDYTKKDYVVATDFADELHFDFSDEFRINQGSNDELVELQKFGDDLVVCFKDSSWAVLANVNFNLANVALDVRGREYGLASRGASVNAGMDVYFLAQNRGICSIRQTELGKVQSVDLPLSDAIQPLIDLINWNVARDKARMAYWENKLYVAVPLKDGNNFGPNLVAGSYNQINPSLPLFPVYGQLDVPGLAIGQDYYYTAGNETVGLYEGSANVSGTIVHNGAKIAPGKFTATTATPCLFTVDLNQTKATAVIAALKTKCNNAILVYDFLTQKWTPRDTGSVLTVRDFYKAQFNGKERLFFSSEDNYINLMEESDAGDQVPLISSTTGLTFNEITTRWRTRAYPTENQRNSRVVELLATLATWNPSYAATLIYDGANETQPQDSNGATAFTRDRTKYFRPFNATDWNPTNVNNDHGTQYRQDYSVPLGASGIYLGSGVQTDLFQETPIIMKVTAKEGRAVQVEITNTQGRGKLKAVELTLMKQPRRAGHLG